MNGEAVILVHGVLAPPLIMWPLARRLTAGGYRVLNWSYPSTRKTIQDHGAALSRFLAEQDSDATVAALHVVAHSMGSIVTRFALSLDHPAKLGRIVLLAPPDRGSPVAARVGPFLKWWGCRTINQLAAGSFLDSLPPAAGLEMCAIAARYDMFVPPSRTYLPGLRMHRVVRTTHNLMLFQPSVAKLLIEYLRTGRLRDE